MHVIRDASLGLTSHIKLQALAWERRVSPASKVGTGLAGGCSRYGCDTRGGLSVDRRQHNIGYLGLMVAVDRYLRFHANTFAMSTCLQCFPQDSARAEVLEARLAAWRNEVRWEDQVLT